MARLSLWIPAALALAACGQTTTEVAVPVPQLVRPPAALLAPVRPPTQPFVAPDDPAAVIGLTEAGKAYLGDLVTRERGIRAWAEALD